MTEDRPKQASEYLTKAARLLAKAKNYDDAASTINKAILLLQESGSTGTCGRLVAALVLIQLAKEDQVAAGMVGEEQYAMYVCIPLGAYTVHFPPRHIP